MAAYRKLSNADSSGASQRKESAKKDTLIDIEEGTTLLSPDDSPPALPFDPSWV